MSGYLRYGVDSSVPFSPVSCRPVIPKAKPDATLMASERHKLIAVAAYLIAEHRSFAPGHELSDWLAAEREVNRVCGLIEPAPRWD